MQGFGCRDIGGLAQVCALGSVLSVGIRLDDDVSDRGGATCLFLHIDQQS